MFTFEYDKILGQSYIHTFFWFLLRQKFKVTFLLNAKTKLLTGIFLIMLQLYLDHLILVSFLKQSTNITFPLNSEYFKGNRDFSY